MKLIPKLAKIAFGVGGRGKNGIEMGYVEKYSTLSIAFYSLFFEKKMTWSSCEYGFICLYVNQFKIP